MMERILIPVKMLGEEGSREALKNAISLAELKPDEKPELIFLHVVHHGNRVPVYMKEEVSELDKEKTEEEFGKIEAICEDYGIENVRTLLREGEPGEEITEVAKEEDVDLVIIGAGKFAGDEGQRAIGEGVYCKIGKDVTEEVLQELSRPVLVCTDSDRGINNGLNRLGKNIASDFDP